MRRAGRTGEIVFSVYAWERPTLSFGRNQTARERYNPGLVAELGLDVVRRPTGGRALVHYREVTYSVTAPVEHGVSMRDSCASINSLLLHALEALGVTASEARPAGRTQPPDCSSCFAAPAAGEIVAGGRKLVGSAQYREGGAFLQHGSILVADDQSIISRLIGVAPFDPGQTIADAARSGPATLADLLGRDPDQAEVEEALFAAVRALEDAQALEIDEAEIRPEALARVGEFTNELWTWRR